MRSKGRIKPLVPVLGVPLIERVIHSAMEGGADEFYVMKDKVKKVKGYRRLNIAVNEHQELVACELTSLHKSEAKQVPKLLKNIKDHSKFIIADKNYDKQSVYDAIIKYRPTKFIRSVPHDEYNIIIPPRANAKIRQQTDKYPLERSKHIKMIQDHGVIQWQKSTGYGVRSLVETAFSRYKRIVGQFMYSKTLRNQKVEAKLACKALNIMASLGMPRTERVN